MLVDGLKTVALEQANLGAPEALRLGPNLVSEGRFSNWSSDDPASPWVIYSAPELSGHEEVTEGSNGGARMFSDSGTIGLQQYNAGFVAGQRYWVSFDVLDATSGLVTAKFGASNVCEASSVGHHGCVITAAAVNLQIYVIGGGDIEIDNVEARLVL